MIFLSESYLGFSLCKLYLPIPVGNEPIDNVRKFKIPIRISPTCGVGMGQSGKEKMKKLKKNSPMQLMSLCPIDSLLLSKKSA